MALRHRYLITKPCNRYIWGFNMLKLDNVQGGYTSGSLVLQGISLTIAKGEVVGIIGLNGCGKSTLGKAVMNMLPHRQGVVWLNDKNLTMLPTHKVKQAGLGMVMQGGRIFKQMSVKEHLHLAGNTKTELELKNNLLRTEKEYGFSIFTGDIPLNRKAGYLSGGERQQLALAMALIRQPQMLILDELSAGLSPSRLEEMAQTIEKLKASQTMGIMLIEQNIRMAVRLADRLLLLERGVIDQNFTIGPDFDMNTLNENIFN